MHTQTLIGNTASAPRFANHETVARTMNSEQLAALLEHKVTVLGMDDSGDQRLASQVRVTPRGLAVLAQKMGAEL